MSRADPHVTNTSVAAGIVTTIGPVWRAWCVQRDLQLRHPIAGALCLGFVGLRICSRLHFKPLERAKAQLHAMNIPIKYHCAFPGCTASAAVELDQFLGLPPKGWTYRVFGDLPDDYYCPEHAEAAEPERLRAREMETIGQS